ncbi:MAG: copper chaperone PCu(A)C [Stellaceae bacterium]
MSIKFLAFAAALAFATATLAQTNQPEVTDAWARATPGKAENGAAYLTIQSPTADRLVSVSTPVAKKAELHTMSMSGGIMQMRPVAGIDVPGGQLVKLKPGGEHVMLLGLNHPLQEGQSFPLTLTFEKGGTRTVDVAIEKVGASGPAHAAKH